MATKTNTKKAQQRETTPPALIAWHVTERGEKKFWNRIGAAGNTRTARVSPCNSISSPPQAAASFSARRKRTHRPTTIRAETSKGAG